MPTIQTLPIATVHFPEIQLPERAAAQLRGYFGNVFREHSPLLHNHLEDGKTRYGCPLVQYKIIDGTPVLVGLHDGAKLLAELFFEMKAIDVNGHHIEVRERDIAFKKAEIGVGEDLVEYGFETLWMALNQDNYPVYEEMADGERPAFLNRILVGNILSFFKGMDFFTEKRVMASFRPTFETVTGFKNQPMRAFGGTFTTNAILPDLIGLGKSVSRGFGAVQRIG